MSTKVFSGKKRSGKRRKKYISVDLWRSSFGPVSVSAIFNIYSQKFNVPVHELKNHSFQKCIDSLRLLENPDYISPNRE